MESADPERPSGGSAHPEHLIRQTLRVATTEKPTRLDAAGLDRAIDRGTTAAARAAAARTACWVGELESNVTMTAQHLFWHHYLGLRTPELDRRIANELMARMRDDGTWSIWFRAARPLHLGRGVRRVPPRRCRSGQAGACLHSARGRDPEGASSRSASWPSSASGRGRRSRRSRPSFVLLPVGNWPHLDLRLLCWARAERSCPRALAVPPPGPPRRTSTCARSAPVPGRRERRAARGLCGGKLKQQPSGGSASGRRADGSWGGIQPPWVWSIMGTRGARQRFGRVRTVAKASRGMERLPRRGSASSCRPEACQSPVSDTALAALALRAVRRLG